MVAPLASTSTDKLGGNSRSTAFRVFAIRYATLATRRSHCFYRYHVYGEADGALQMDYYFWVLRRASQTILVDTGFDPVVGARRGRTCLCPPVEALSRLGVAPSDVSTVVVTHMHYDHIGNLAAFPDAEFCLSRRELEFWTGPIARRLHFAETVQADEVQFLAKAWSDGRVRCLDGEEPVAPGLTAICVGGHSPGQLVLVVEGTVRPVVLASDSVHFYEELETDRPFGVVSDLREMYEGYDLLRGLERDRNAVLVPGHDPIVLQKFATLDGAAEGLAVEVI
jgi:glyoxylase-like metal-dependent hydrolase (beta-lactamase superfamily II)